MLGSSRPGELSPSTALSTKWPYMGPDHMRLTNGNQGNWGRGLGTTHLHSPTAPPTPSAASASKTLTRGAAARGATGVWPLPLWLLLPFRQHLPPAAGTSPGESSLPARLPVSLPSIPGRQCSDAVRFAYRLGTQLPCSANLLLRFLCALRMLLTAVPCPVRGCSAMLVSCSTDFLGEKLTVIVRQTMAMYKRMSRPPKFRFSSGPFGFLHFGEIRIYLGCLNALVLIVNG